MASCTRRGASSLLARARAPKRGPRDSMRRQIRSHIPNNRIVRALFGYKRAEMFSTGRRPGQLDAKGKAEEHQTSCSSTRADKACKNSRKCESEGSCPSRSLEREDMKECAEHDATEYNSNHGHPSVSSMFPYGPGSTDPSEWPLRSFYKRELPSSCIRFGSSTGIQMFQEALVEGTASSYFPLAEQFRTQDEPAFCGLSTLTMVLNSLAIDPGRIWKGGWRWFSEEMLDCCESLEKIRKKRVWRHATVLKLKNGALWDVSAFPSIVYGSSEGDVFFLPRTFPNRLLFSFGARPNWKWSLVAAYHEATDMVLIMPAFPPLSSSSFQCAIIELTLLVLCGKDTARFKYPPHWTPLELLVEAMRKIDADSGKPRGYMKLSRASGDGGPSSSILFVMTLRKGFDEGALRNIRRFFASVKNAKIENAAARETEEAGGMTREVAEKAHGNRAEEHRTSEHLQPSPNRKLGEVESLFFPMSCLAAKPSGWNAKSAQTTDWRSAMLRGAHTEYKLLYAVFVFKVSKYVSCFFSAAPKELLDAVGTVVHEFRIDPDYFGELHVRPQYQEIGHHVKEAE
eukprot:jgi/Bigna1/78911/fgenesh1_pg.58_\